MANATLKAFVTRKEACENHDVSDRSLGRYLKKAMLKNDDAFLANFKLVTIDGDIIEGSEVTIELINKLQDEARVPTWLVSSDWLARKFPFRNVSATPNPPEKNTEIETQPERRGLVDDRDHQDELIQLLKEQVQSLDADKTRLEEEKKEMRIDARETRNLMNQMQQLMGHMQDRLLPEKTTTQSSVTPTADPEIVATPTPGTTKPRPARTRKTKKATRRPKQKTSIWKRDVRELLSLR